MRKGCPKKLSIHIVILKQMEISFHSLLQGRTMNSEYSSGLLLLLGAAAEQQG